MKKYTMLKRIMSLGLALALFVSSQATVLAVDESNSAVAETTIDNTASTETVAEGESVANEDSTSVEANNSESDAGSDGAAQASSDNSTSEVIPNEIEVNNDDATTSEADTDEPETEDDGKKTESDDAEDEEETNEEADEDEIVYSYVSNNDGTHIKSWTDKDGVYHEETEDCTFGEDGKCEKCGYEKEEELTSEDKEYEIDVEGAHIKANVPAGSFSENVEFHGKKVELTDSQRAAADSASTVSVDDYYAFDIFFLNVDGNEINPNDGYSIDITITLDTSMTDVVLSDEVVHIKDDNATETIKIESNENDVSFKAESFSIYALEGVSTDRVFYKNSAYGAAYSDAQYYSKTGTYEEAASQNKDRFAIQINYTNGYTKFAPTNTDSDKKCFLYGSQGSNNGGDGSYFHFYFIAPENYIISKIEILKGSYGTKTYTPNTQSYEFTEQLVRIENSNVNKIILTYERVSTQLTSTYTYVDGATLVNYVDNTNYFGSSFLFNDGKGSGSNKCNYAQVYQGLATNDITSGTFSLSNGNGVPLFPSYSNYANYSGEYVWRNNNWYTIYYKDYITDYYNNAKVQFNKDTDGYWTLDSSKYKYVNNGTSSNAIISPSAYGGEQFRPFDYDNNHFGMVLPITFSVNSDGTTNGNDTIFRFAGDDDVFVYIDGKLVLDLGGIHDKVYGQINFKTGDVLIQGDYNNVLKSSIDSTVYASEGIKDTNIYNILSENNVSELSQKEHKLTVVYFERGGNVSNCKISFNFQKNETRDVEYKGLKVNENYDGLAGAVFTLYTNEECDDSHIAEMGVGQSATTTSDAQGTIKFEGLSAGIIPEGQTSVSKVYYMKETQAPDGYDTPTNAKWKLTITAYSDGTSETSLLALNADAQEISIDSSWQSISSSDENVKAIKNTPTVIPKTLKITKNVSYCFDDIADENAEYSFRIEYISTVGEQEIYSVLANQSYKIGDVEYATDENGIFKLKVNETAIFDNLTRDKYQITEMSAESPAGFDLNNYDTIVSIDDNEVAEYNFSSASYRTSGVIEYADDTIEHSVLFENILSNVYAWQLVKTDKNGTPLSGAQFILASVTDSSKKTVYYGKSDDSGVVLWFESATNRDSMINPVDVEAGKYTLYENKAPDGYKRSTEIWNITVSEHAQTTAYIETEGDIDSFITYTEVNQANGGRIVTVNLNFENQLAYTLPETGGSGVYVYTIGGILLMLAGALLLYKNKNNKNK